jgi:hypothetical protein
MALREKFFPKIDKPFKCVCGKSFTSTLALLYHQTTVHTATTVVVTSGPVNDFCKENQSYLTKEFIYQCATNLVAGIVDMFRHMHFNKEHPENHNVRLVSKHDNIIDIIKDGRWQPASKSYVLDKIVDYSYMKLSGVYDSPEFHNGHSEEDKATMLFLCNDVRHPASRLNHIIKRNMFIIIAKETELRNKEPLLKDMATTSSHETEDNTNGAKESGSDDGDSDYGGSNDGASGSNDGASGFNGSKGVTSEVPDPKVSPLQLFDRIEHNVQEALVQCTDV